ncbi:hypothetical protein Goari_000913, partial [Gossypium aridum]|nr:hypothetical protein [Gossypium aridum]
MWNLKLPSKIHIGMWKITNEFMPTLHNLRNRRLVVYDLCPMCKVEKESVAYLVWDCAFTMMVLQELGVDTVQEVVSFINAYRLEIDMLEGLLVSKPIPKNVKWDMVKINFDASFQQQTNKSCSRFIARNIEGIVMAVCAYPYESVSSSAMAEARACLQVVTLGEELGFKE